MSTFIDHNTHRHLPQYIDSALNYDLLRQYINIQVLHDDQGIKHEYIQLESNQNQQTDAGNYDRKCGLSKTQWKKQQHKQRNQSSEAPKSELHQRVEKYVSKAVYQRMKHLKAEKHVNGESITQADFQALQSRIDFSTLFPSEIWPSDQALGIFTLHGCGDLSANVLRTFLLTPDIQFALVVSCCYGLITEGDAEFRKQDRDYRIGKQGLNCDCDDDELCQSSNVSSSPSCFPLSSYLQTLNCQIGYRIRSVMWRPLFTADAISEETLRYHHHYQRCGLELLLSQWWPLERKQGAVVVHHLSSHLLRNAETSFSRYVHASIEPERKPVWTDERMNAWYQQNVQAQLN